MCNVVKSKTLSPPASIVFKSLSANTYRDCRPLALINEGCSRVPASHECSTNQSTK